MSNLLNRLVLITLLIAVFYSCKKDETTEETKGNVTVKLTDAPFPFAFVSEANIGIAKIELKNADGDYIVLFESNTSTSYNLLDFTNGATASVATTAIATGIYSHAKVTLAEASILMNGNISDSGSGDTTFNFNSEANTSYEIAIDPQLEVEEGNESNILFDVDVNKTFTFTTSSILIDDWFSVITEIVGCNFDPSIKVCDLDKTGEITGTITLNGEHLENAHVTLIDKGETIAAHTKADGTFTFIGVKAGLYDIEVAIKEQRTQRMDVTVSGTNTSVVNFAF